MLHSTQGTPVASKSTLQISKEPTGGGFEHIHHKEMIAFEAMDKLSSPNLIIIKCIHKLQCYIVPQGMKPYYKSVKMLKLIK